MVSADTIARVALGMMVISYMFIMGALGSTEWSRTPSFADGNGKVQVITMGLWRRCNEFDGGENHCKNLYNDKGICTDDIFDTIQNNDDALDDLKMSCRTNQAAAAFWTMSFMLATALLVVIALRAFKHASMPDELTKKLAMILGGVIMLFMMIAWASFAGGHRQRNNALEVIANGTIPDARLAAAFGAAFLAWIFTVATATLVFFMEKAAHAATVAGVLVKGPDGAAAPTEDADAGAGAGASAGDDEEDDDEAKDEESGEAKHEDVEGGGDKADALASPEISA